MTGVATNGLSVEKMLVLVFLKFTDCPAPFAEKSNAGVTSSVGLNHVFTSKAIHFRNKLERHPPYIVGTKIPVQ